MLCPWQQWVVGEETPAAWRSTWREIRVHWLRNGLHGGSAGEASIKKDARFLNGTDSEGMVMPSPRWAEEEQGK